MKVVTFNIRCDYCQDGLNEFANRKELILRKINQEKPDIIGFQEVLPHVAKWLKENLNEYYVIGCGRGANLRDEQMSIAYRRDRINLISMKTWWLSQTPDVPGSRYKEQSSCPRTATEAVFEDIKNDKVFRFINTHLDHIGAQAREKGLTQIINQLKQEHFWKDIPVILCGDFNAEPNAPEMEIISRDSSFNNLTKDIGITFHGYYKNDPNDPPCSIDYIVLKGDWQCETVYKWTDEENGIYLSDHYPVCAVINLVQQQNHCTDGGS